MQPTDLIADQIAESALVHKDPVEFAAQLSEFTIDQLLDDSFLKNIPWVEWIPKAKTAWSTISDRILLAKIAKFF